MTISFKNEANPTQYQMKIAVILGTRPEIIKMSPVIRSLLDKKEDFFILHTGQHYSYDMDRSFFDVLSLPNPAYNLDVGSGTHAGQTGKIMAGIETVLLKEQPDAVLVQGDTNTVLAGALAAVKLHIPVGHVEAGLRSFDRRMPEEINRIVADHVSDFLFAPTETAKNNLLHEGIPENNIFITGNTIVDAVSQNLGIAGEKTDSLRGLGIARGCYFLATAHRAENVDGQERLEKIVRCLSELHDRYNVPVIFPIHPRTEARLREYGTTTNGILVCPPRNFLEFLQLEANARLILTDSGGVQEEACILGVPCITLRDSTERPETVMVGANRLAGVEPEAVLMAADKMLTAPGSWKNPFGDGTAADRIVGILQNFFNTPHCFPS